MLWVLAAVIAALLAVGVVFDLAARRRGSYRDPAHFKAASKQRRSQRLNLLHTLYERRTGERGPGRGRGPGRPSG